jgi:hypothetical protein
MYYHGMLLSKLGKKIPQELIQLLEDSLESSPYWKDRFDDFNLSHSHLQENTFPELIRT